MKIGFCVVFVLVLLISIPKTDANHGLKHRMYTTLKRIKVIGQRIRDHSTKEIQRFELIIEAYAEI